MQLGFVAPLGRAGNPCAVDPVGCRLLQVKSDDTADSQAVSSVHLVEEVVSPCGKPLTLGFAR